MCQKSLQKKTIQAKRSYFIDQCLLGMRNQLTRQTAK
jgi:hypothetical protein